MRFNSKLDKLADEAEDRLRDLEPEERFRQFIGARPDKQKALMETIPGAKYRMPNADHADPIKGFHRAVEGWLVLWKSASVDYAWAWAAVTVFRRKQIDALREGDEKRAEELTERWGKAQDRAVALAEDLAGIYAGLKDWLADIDVDEETFWVYLGAMADSIQTRIDVVLDKPVEREPDPETREMAFQTLAERGPEGGSE